MAGVWRGVSSLDKRLERSVVSSGDMDLLRLPCPGFGPCMCVCDVAHPDTMIVIVADFSDRRGQRQIGYDSKLANVG